MPTNYDLLVKNQLNINLEMSFARKFLLFSLFLILPSVSFADADLEYKNVIYEHINKHIINLKLDFLEKEETLIAHIELDKEGKVIYKNLIKKSSQTELNDKVLAMLESASPYPVKKEMEEEATVVIPLLFIAND